MSSGARSTSVLYLRDCSLLTTATNPSNSARAPNGSTYDSMKPM
jgi:hypothetical protein